MGGLVLARLRSLLEQWISVCTKALYDVDWLGYPCWVNRYELIGKSHRRGVILAGICPIPWGMGSNPHWCKISRPRLGRAGFGNTSGVTYTLAPGIGLVSP